MRKGWVSDCACVVYQARYYMKIRRRLLDRHVRSFVKRLFFSGSESGGGQSPRWVLSPLPETAIAVTNSAGNRKGPPMNPVIQLKQTTSIFLVAFGLACFVLSPAARAV